MAHEVVIPGVAYNLALALKYEAEAARLDAECRRLADLHPRNVHYPAVHDRRCVAWRLRDKYLRAAEAAERAHYGA